MHAALDASLRRLQLDYVDLYLIHSPVAISEGDADKPESLRFTRANHAALWRSMEACVDAGRARSIGVSNFNVQQLRRVLDAADGIRIRPACNQIEMHLYMAARELCAFCDEQVT